MERTSRGAFWDDLAEDLKDPEFLRTYIVESIRIATMDRRRGTAGHGRASRGEVWQGREGT